MAIAVVVMTGPFGHSSPKGLTIRCSLVFSRLLLPSSSSFAALINHTKTSAAAVVSSSISLFRIGILVYKVSCCCMADRAVCALILMSRHQLASLKLVVS